MVELMIENGASKGEAGAARRARDEWVQQFGRGKVPDLCTFRRNYKKWKTQPTGVLNLHAFVRKVSALLFLKSGFWFSGLLLDQFGLIYWDLASWGEQVRNSLVFIIINQALWVVEVSNWGYKITKIFSKNQHTQKKSLGFEN